MRPTKEKDDGKVYGVLPYVAPEVLLGKGYTQASDIYSFGIIAYELFSGLPPYHDIAHDNHLALEILKGLRPEFRTKIPSLLEDLINRCWNVNPLIRPTVNELAKILNDCYYKEIKDKNSKFSRQFQEAEEFNKKAPATFLNYQPHPSAIYTSRLLDFKNLSESQNGKEINEQFYNSSSQGLHQSSALELTLEELSFEENEQDGQEPSNNSEELIAQIQIPPKQN